MSTYSVITICLNSEDTIHKSIDSVLKQNPLPAEYIFVDGRSNDSTIEIIDRLKKRIDKENIQISLKILHQKEKSGIYGAMNIGLKAVSSDLVFILNSDDWYEPNTATTVIDKFANSADIEIVYSSAFFHNNKGDSKSIRIPRPLIYFPFLMPLAHPATFVKKSVYDKLGLFDESYSISGDYDFLYRCYKNNARFCEIRKPLVNMLLGGAANSNRPIARKETYEIAKKYSCCKLLPFLAYIIRLFLKK